MVLLVIVITAGLVASYFSSVYLAKAQLDRDNRTMYLLKACYTACFAVGFLWVTKAYILYFIFSGVAFYVLSEIVRKKEFTH